MKHLLVLTLFLTSLSINAQGYEAKYKADICGCIETKKSTLQVADKIYNACFAKHMTTYAVFIDTEIKEEDKTRKFIEGQKIRRDLNQKFKYELVYSCDVYFDIIETKKQHVLQQYRSKRIDSSRIDKLNETVAMQPHYSNYFNRGQFYYFIGDLQKAELDVQKSIEENPFSQGNTIATQESLLLAMIHEEQKRYAEAIAIYDAINSKGINPSVEILKAIVFRKSKGYDLKPKEVLEKNTPNSTPNTKPENNLIESSKNSTSTRNTAKILKPQTRTSRLRSSQTNQPNSITPREPEATKSKDSTKSLRGLFKLD